MAKVFRIVSFCILALLPGLAVAQTTFEVRGYVKNLGIRSSSILSGESYLLDISRLRTQGFLDVGGRVPSPSGRG